MSVLYESWEQSGADWTKSTIYLQCVHKDRTQRKGVREWMTRIQLVAKFGEEGADAIIQHKKNTCTTEIRPRPNAPDCEAWL